MCKNFIENFLKPLQYKLRDWKALRDQREGEHGHEPAFLLAPGSSQSITKIVYAVTHCGADVDEVVNLIKLF